MVEGAFKKVCIPPQPVSAERLNPEVYSQSAQFFALPQGIKVSDQHNQGPIPSESEIVSLLQDKLAWYDPRANRGYVRIGRERVTQSSDAHEIAELRAKAPDYKETMEIGREWDKTWWNCWPAEDAAPGFKSTMLEYFQTCHELHVIVMRAIALGLELEENHFDRLIDEQYHNLRLLSYPPIKASLLEQEGQARAGAHSGRYRFCLCGMQH